MKFILFSLIVVAINLITTIPAYLILKFVSDKLLGLEIKFKYVFLLNSITTLTTTIFKLYIK